MRLIDADKLTELCDIMADKCGGIGASIWNQFRTTTEWSPTVDAVPVVRCGECIHNYGLSFNGEFNPNDIVCGYWDTDGLSYDDFCSYGERKDGYVLEVLNEN